MSTTATEFTRKDYLNKLCTHREYYAQFVTPGTLSLVLAGIGLKRLLAAKDEHLNDIPMSLWDRLVPRCPGSGKFRDAGDFYTKSGGVCLLKEAARQLIETYGTSSPEETRS